MASRYTPAPMWTAGGLHDDVGKEIEALDDGALDRAVAHVWRSICRLHWTELRGAHRNLALRREQGYRALYRALRQAA